MADYQKSTVTGYRKSMFEYIEISAIARARELFIQGIRNRIKINEFVKELAEGHIKNVLQDQNAVLHKGHLELYRLICLEQFDILMKRFEKDIPFDAMLN
jgi:hypothetical protein